MSIIEKAIEKLGADQERRQGELQSEPDQLSAGMPGEPTTDNTALVDDESSTNRPENAVQLPFDLLKSLGMVTPDEPRSIIAEENRIIKRPLLMNIAGKGAAKVTNPNLIMVTSAQPAEGKTFSAINLAISIAMEQDKTVLFVDADVARAAAAALLGIPDDCPGLIDLLMDKGSKIGDVLLHTNIPNLRIIPVGHAHERSTELLASENMQRLMGELAQRYPDRVIIFDSPPILFTTEAGVLANLMGQIVFVVAEGVTPQDKVTEALSHLGDDKIIGLLLNKSTSKGNGIGGYGYGYGYGQGYGYNYRHEYTKKS